MMNGRKVVLAVTAALGPAAPSLAAPPAWTVIDDDAVEVLANTPASPAYRCSYRIALSFANGVKLVEDGQADLPAGAAKHRAASLAFDTAISAAVLDDWTCHERQAPLPRMP